MKLLEIINKINIISYDIKKNIEIENISLNSNQVNKNGLFVAIKGDKVNGNDFISDAIKNGAVVIVSEEEIHVGCDIAFILVSSSRKAFAEIAKEFYGNHFDEFKSIAITGTNGKTSTGYIIKHILDNIGIKTGLISTISNQITDYNLPSIRTTPEADQLHNFFYRMKKNNCSDVIVEVSSHALSLDRVYGMNFDICIFTNLSPDHLDFHDSMEKYYKIKKELFFNIKNSNSKRVINIDNKWGKRLAEELGDQLITYGTSNNALIRIKGIKEYLNETTFKIHTPSGACKITTPLIGRCNVYNITAAIASLYYRGINFNDLKKSLKKIETISGRLDLISSKQKKYIFIDYAHTEDALNNALKTMKSICKKEIWIVFGCGGNRDKSKRFKMGNIAAKYSNHIIITSDNPRNEDPKDICNEIIKGCKKNSNVRIVLDRTEAIQYALKNMKSKDILLIAGKGHESYQEINGQIINYNDYNVVKEFLND